MRLLGRAGAAVWGLTAVATLLGAIVPPLAPSGRPHPTLHGTLGDALSILANNARVLAVPFLLVLLGFPRSRVGRGAGDLILMALTAASTIPVGLELGRWQGRLLAYLPQLPLEWTALTLAIDTWVIARKGHVTVRRLAPWAAVTLALLIAAASLETWCAPHPQATPHVTQTDLDTAREPISTVGAGGCFRRGFCADSGHIASRSRAPFPLLRSVPLGRSAGADRATSTTTDPHKEGIT